MPYEQINMKKSNYSSNVESFIYSNSNPVGENKEDFKNLCNNFERLRIFMNNQLKIMLEKEKNLKDLKIKMKYELQVSKDLLNKISFYEN